MFGASLIVLALLAGLGREASSLKPQAELGNTEAFELREIIEAQRAESNVPALGVAVANSERPLFIHVVGERAVGSGEAVEQDDRFHIGSVTKPITATAIARLVERGIIDWSTTPVDVWPEASGKMNPQLRRITVEQLLSHRAGLPPFEADEEIAVFPRRYESPRQERERFAHWLLVREPSSPVGEHVYSNAGYGIAAAMAEKRANLGWEEIVRREVFEPLDLSSCGFGWPTDLDPSQPRGHRVIDGEVRVHDLADGYRLTPPIVPAGDIHCALADLLKFGQAHLEGLDGETAYLSSSAFRKLHAAPVGDYALGWNVRSYGAHHLGSAGTFVANLILFKKDDLVAALVTNAPSLSDKQISSIMSSVYKRYRQTPAKPAG